MNYYGTRRLLRLTRTTTTTARIEHHQLIYLIHPSIRPQNSSFFSSQTNSENPRSKKDEGQDNYLSELKNTKTNWKPIPIWIGASLLGLITYLKKIDERSGSEGEGSTRKADSTTITPYSVDALLLGPNEQKKLNESEGKKRSSEESQVSNSRFANINDISYSVDELMGGSENTQHDQDPTESSVASQPVSPGAGLASSVKVHTDIVRGELETLPSSGNRMFFFVVYLAPGDYHRFHSPADWKVERRRHFAGELFSVSPWMAGKLADLFVLNERVALLGRWRHGFFSMTPVGATNVGSILINFDRELRTNRVDKRCHEEMVYGTNNAIFDGQVLAKGTEVGAFSLGSTIVLVFEAPEQFQFSVKKGEPVRVGQAIGNI
ncbi:phosphatidylserine decarboxylase 1 [Puccinia graminis f. sp. tritici]|uniref:phosphatidylserine decarboxylase n=1 Tax=Puccinia graminis f. sp. tritici TaxID=56615 RepID=A0A5B0PPE9_PUCGR|nr:phosphatidylserine decarboxylase 1 [Puccinia graminis f. sp. tritici]